MARARSRILICLPIAAVAALSAASYAQPVAGAVQVSQMNRRFAPDSVALPAGGSLRILNDDRFIHHVYVEADVKKFDSGDQRPGESVNLPFAGAGIYHIRCAIHPKMKLTVTVGAAPEDRPAAK